MALTSSDVQTLAHLTQIRLEPDSLQDLANSLSQLAGAAATIRSTDTDGIEPLINPLDITQRLRADTVSEDNLRELYQSIAPATEDGLYLVPKVLD